MQNTHQPPSVLVGDDHAVVRRGLCEIVGETCTHASVQEAATGRDVLDATRQQDWSLVILDINLPDMNGLDVLKEVKALRPAVPVLVLSQHAEGQYAARAYKAGAAGYLTKDCAPHELALAIRKVLGGGRYVSPSFAETLAGNLGGDITASLHEVLSDREHHVLCLLAQGKTVSGIAEQLCLSVNTISTYRTRVLSKLHLETTADLMRYAFDHKLVE